MEREDRISALPDGVLCHILSFLPTHNSITTSCLSKRWLPLWRFALVIDIHLDDETYLRSGCTYSHFLNFAYVILLSPNTKEPLMLARLLVNTRVHPHYDFPEAHFNIWVKAILERGIKHLHLEMPILLSLTNNVFSCRTLVVLKLRLVGVNILQYVGLPMLKTLHLDYVRMRKIDFVSRILHGCPTIEELRVNHVNLGMIGEHQNMSELIRADIGTNFGIDFPLNVVSNV